MDDDTDDDGDASIGGASGGAIGGASGGSDDSGGDGDGGDASTALSGANICISGSMSVTKAVSRPAHDHDCLPPRPSALAVQTLTAQIKACGGAACASVVCSRTLLCLQHIHG